MLLQWNQDKLRPAEPLRLYGDFTLPDMYVSEFPYLYKF